MSCRLVAVRLRRRHLYLENIVIAGDSDLTSTHKFHSVRRCSLLDSDICTSGWESLPSTALRSYMQDYCSTCVLQQSVITAFVYCTYTIVQCVTKTLHGIL